MESVNKALISNILLLMNHILIIQALRETEPMTIGEIKIPLKYFKSSEKPGKIPVELSYQDLQKLLAQMVS